MATSENYRWRKATDIRREFALFELMDGDTPVLDVGFSDDGIFEVAFNPTIGGTVVEWGQLLKLLGEGKILAESDRKSFC
jgi:hypothetical protein